MQPSALLEQHQVFWQRDAGIERVANLPHAVIISGLRRVGKSTLLAQLSHRLGKSASFAPHRLLSIENTWLIAHTHSFHANIGQYCDRLEGWQDLIVENWNRFILCLLKYKNG